MAGIGFKLRKIFEKDSYLDTLRGVLFSTAVAGGPILFSILCLILLGLFSTVFVSSGEMNLFLVTVVYVFAFSLISTGVSQLIITRYLSDLVYLNAATKILPAFTIVLGVTITLQLAIAAPLVLFWQIDFLYKMSALILFIAVGCIWQLMIFLSAVKNYKVVLYAFAIGLTTSFILATLLGDHYGISGFLHGYTIGQVVLLFILLARIFVEFRSDEKPDFDVLNFFREMPLLIVIGLFYNIGIWIDKIIFWFSPRGEQVHAFLYAFTDYDGATFIAFITVIPSYTYFLVKVETDFYGQFRDFFRSILGKRSLQRIVADKNDIARSVRESLGGLIKLQGTITVLCLLFATDISAFFKLPAVGTLILEKAFIAVFLQMMLLTIMIFMFYFDIKAQLVAVVSVFLASNVLLTLLSLSLGYIYYGYGYLLACLLALVTGYALLNRHLNQLEYHTFVSQPITT